MIQSQVLTGKLLRNGNMSQREKFFKFHKMSQALITAKPEKLEKWKNHNV